LELGCLRKNFQMNIIDDIKRQYQFGGINQRLIFWNIGCFLVSLVFFYRFSIGIFSHPNWLALSSDSSISFVFPWTFLSYSFLHAGLLHLIFNLIVLNFSGRLFLTFFNEKQLFGVYVLGAIFSGLFFVFFYYFFRLSNVLLVGASASIMAILFATATYSPLMNVRLLLIGNVKLWHIALAILVIDVLQIGLSNTGGHISHLAGALFGFLFVSLVKQGTDMTKIVSKTTAFFTRIFSKKAKKKYTPFKKVYVNKKAKNTFSEKTKFDKNKNQQLIDQLLDKISRSGYQSLTKEEKDFLFQQKD